MARQYTGLVASVWSVKIAAIAQLEQSMFLTQIRCLLSLECS